MAVSLSLCSSHSSNGTGDGEQMFAGANLPMLVLLWLPGLQQRQLTRKALGFHKIQHLTIDMLNNWQIKTQTFARHGNREKQVFLEEFTQIAGKT